MMIKPILLFVFFLLAGCAIAPDDSEPLYKSIPFEKLKNNRSDRNEVYRVAGGPFCPSAHQECVTHPKDGSYVIYHFGSTAGNIHYISGHGAPIKSVPYGSQMYVVVHFDADDRVKDVEYMKGETGCTKSGVQINTNSCFD